MKPYDILTSFGGDWSPLRDIGEPRYILMIEKYDESIIVPEELKWLIAGLRVGGRQTIRPRLKLILSKDREDDIPTEVKITVIYTKRQVLEAMELFKDIEGLTLSKTDPKQDRTPLCKLVAFQLTSDCIIGEHSSIEYSFALNNIKINYINRRQYIKY